MAVVLVLAQAVVGCMGRNLSNATEGIVQTAVGGVKNVCSLVCHLMRVRMVCACLTCSLPYECRQSSGLGPRPDLSNKIVIGFIRENS